MAQRLSDVQQWQTAFMSEKGPDAMIRHILLTLSVRMTRDGDSSFPSTKLIATRTGRTERTVCTRLAEADAAGRKRCSVGEWASAIPGPSGWYAYESVAMADE